MGQVNKKGSTTELYLDEDVVDTENPKGTPTVIHVGVSSLFNAHNFDGARLNKWELDKTGTYKYCENDFHIFRALATARHVSALNFSGIPAPSTGYGFTHYAMREFFAVGAGLIKGELSF